MSEEVKKSRSFIDKLKDQYRMVVLEEETLSEVRSFNLSLLSVYITICSAFLLTSAIITSLIIFTPVKRWVPGYGNVNNSMEFLNLKNEVEDLEGIIETQNVYIDGLKEMVSGGEIPKDIHPDTLDMGTSTTSGIAVGDGQSSSSGANLSRNALSHIYLNPPLKGTISSGYLSVPDHLGVDIVAPEGSPIVSILEGIVVSSDWTIETGHSITVQHPDNIISVYKHNDRLLKVTGDRIKQGESIAIIGNTGRLTSGPHLHFELWYNGNSVNPANFIDFSK